MTETFETIRFTADVVVTTTDGYVLLIERGWPPYEGAAPEELDQIGVFDRPDRDPRGRYVTVAYHLTVVPGTPVEAGDDATKAEWWPLNSLPPLAFDHADILAAATRK
ncbi:NUDIX hydrolase [Streptomyces yokosukanensis]|nr:NUDIX hydrolase [Streptomyces yokosukanensis]